MDGDPYCISVDRDMTIKGILFSASVCNGCMGFNNICLEKGFMHIWKGLINYEAHVY